MAEAMLQGDAPGSDPGDAPGAAPLLLRHLRHRLLIVRQEQPALQVRVPRVHAAEAGSQMCGGCGAGKHFPFAGASECLVCGAGKYSPGTHNTGCTDSPVHAYQDQEGQAKCTSCPEGSETTDSGSEAASDCLCSPGFQSSDGGVDGTSGCTACPKMEFKAGIGQGACEACKGDSHSGTAWAKCRCNHGKSNPIEKNLYFSYLLHHHPHHPNWR